MGIDFYYMALSAPCRAVMMGAKNLGVELNLKLTNIMAGENKTDEYLKMNPQHTVPTMDDDGLYINESRAMLQYLADQYGSDDSLYPKCPKKRAIVDSRMYFDMGTLYTRFAQLYYPIIFAGVKTIDDDKLEKFEESLGWLEQYLSDGYVAGDHLTIADFTVMATLATAEACGHEMSPFPGVVAYMDKCKEEIQGYSELNQTGADQFGEWAKPAVDAARAAS